MQLYRNLEEAGDAIRHGAVSIGNFDGVHRGHAQLFARLVAQARSVHGPAVAFTFEPHPVRLLRPDQAPPPLTWTERKASLVGELGVDALVVYPTDLPLLSLTPDAFFRKIVLDQLAARAIVEGPNFYFGRDRAGDTEVLADLCRQSEILVEIVDPLTTGGDYISSSRIRRLVLEGRMQDVAELLIQPYRIRGMVTHGAARGAKLGFPTANLAGIDTLLPAHGVYGGRAYLEGQVWPAAIHIGPNPTFGEAGSKVEVHLIGFEQVIYGQVLEVDFLAQLRDIRSFGSADELCAQLKRDIEQAAALSAGRPQP